MKYDLSRLPGVLRRQRAKLGLTLEQMGSRLGYTKSMIHRLENDNLEARRMPTAERLFEIAEAYEFSIEKELGVKDAKVRH